VRHILTIAGLRWRALAIALAAICFATGAFALTFPALTGRVVDQANILGSIVRADLTAKLQDLQAKTTTQLVVVTLNSLEGTSIEDYGYQLGREWKIGQQGVNNGALLIVAPNERKVRIEVGYGLEGTLTDAVSKLIIENSIIPRFKAGDIPGGIVRGTDDLVQVLSGGAEEFKARAKPAVRQAGWFVRLLSWFFTSEWGFMIALFTIVLALNGVRSLATSLGFAPPHGKAKSGFWYWWDTTRVSSGSRPIGGGSWSSSSGSSSSSGGGFSGGGGSFGGGGSSGSW
jgi:uncharacterized protein